MILPDVPYTPDMYRHNPQPVRVWYSISQAKRKEAIAALAKVRDDAKGGADDGALEEAFVDLFRRCVNAVEIGDVMHIMPDDPEAATALIVEFPLKFLVQSVTGIAAELYDADFVKK